MSRSVPACLGDRVRNDERDGRYIGGHADDGGHTVLVVVVVVAQPSATAVAHPVEPARKASGLASSVDV